MRPISSVPLIELNKVDKRLSTLVFSKDTVPAESYRNFIPILEDRIKSSLIVPILNDLKMGRFILTHTDKEVKVPVIIPSFVIMQNNEIKPVIDLTSHARMLQTGELKMNANAFYTLLHTGYIHKKLVQDMSRLQGNDNSSLFSSAMSFSKLLTKVFDKLYAVNVNSQVTDLIHFLNAKYFIHFMVEVNEVEVTESIAYRCTSEKYEIAQLKSMIPEDHELNRLDGYNKGIMHYLEQVLDLTIRKGDTKNKKVNARQVVMEWVLMYGKSSLIALEYLPYFYHMLHSVAFGGMLGKDFMIENTLNKLTLDTVTRISGLYR